MTKFFHPTFSRLFRLLAVAILSLGALSTSLLFAPTAQAQISEHRPNTEIAQVRFHGGSLKQDVNNYGRWTEHDARGALRYVFREIMSDNSGFTLRGQASSVELYVNLKTRSISGQWAGHPMAKIYTITGVDPWVMSIKPAMAPSRPTPQMADEPMTTATGEIATRVTPETLRRADYSGGRFVKTDSQNWTEFAQNAARFSFQQIGKNKDSVFLYDPQRLMLIEINTNSRVINLAEQGGALRQIYTITKLNPNQAISTPLEPGQLSPSEHAMCLARGGEVKKSGMMGTERCIKPLSDGGKTCRDSADCQGKCVAETFDAFRNDVTGTCQMTDSPFGCYAEVKGGKTEAALCVD